MTTIQPMGELGGAYRDVPTHYLTSREARFMACLGSRR
jgi:hypothetical protein